MPWLQTLVLVALLPLLSVIARVRISRRENIPDGGYIAAANHRSNLDALFVAMAIRRRIRFMGKSELFGARWGGLMNRLGAFPVQRGVWDEDAFETAATVLRRGRVTSTLSTSSPEPSSRRAPGSVPCAAPGRRAAG